MIFIVPKKQKSKCTALTSVVPAVKRNVMSKYNFCLEIGFPLSIPNTLSAYHSYIADVIKTAF